MRIRCSKPGSRTPARRYRYALPIRTYEPVQYEPAPPGDGLAQPVLLKRERVIETYANPEVEEVVAEEVQAEPSYPETPEHCEPHATGDCKASIQRR